MTNFTLPLKKSAKYPRRKTICLSTETDNFLMMLESHKDKGIDVHQFIRNALTSYIDKNESDIELQIKKMSEIKKAS